MQPYSTLKAAWHLDRIQALREGRRIAPVELQLILSDYCNHDCWFCAYRASNGLSQERFVEWDGEKRIHNPQRMMDENKAHEIVGDAAEMGVKSIIFTGGGEPTVHPKHLDVFRHALDRGIDCSLNTNGVSFRSGWDEVLPKFTYVRFSVDAANEEEYAQVRRCPPSHYHKMLRHLSELRTAVDTAGSACTVGTGYVVTKDNYQNLYEGVRRLRDAGAHYVRLAAMQSTDDKAAYGDEWDMASDKAEEVQSKLHENGFAVYNLMNGVVGEQPDYSFCGFQHLVLYVGANLECYRCCYTAYTDHGLVGSLKEQSLRDYIKSREIEPFDARSCRVCPLNAKNRVIHYLTQKDPTHVNFV